MKQLTSANSIDELLSEHDYSLLVFSASWCGSCKSMSPIVEEVSSMMSDRFNAIKVDVDDSPSHAADYGIRSVPTMVLVNNDEIISQHVGVMPPQKLMQWLEQLT